MFSTSKHHFVPNLSFILWDVYYYYSTFIWCLDFNHILREFTKMMWLSFSFNMNIYPMTAYGQCHIHLNQIIYYIRRKNTVSPVLSGSFLAHCYLSFVFSGLCSFPQRAGCVWAWTTAASRGSPSVLAAGWPSELWEMQDSCPRTN